jgi:hypothetical protein
MKRLILSALFAVAALTLTAASYIAVTGQYIDGSASTQTYGTNTNVVCVVKTAATNFYLMPTGNNPGDNTNLWPAIPMPQANNLVPWRTVGLQTQFTMSASNGAAVTFRFAGSSDGSHWHSNAFFFAVTTNAAAAALTQSVTNLTAYYPWYALQQIENPGPGNVTNLFLNGAPLPQ